MTTERVQRTQGIPLLFASLLVFWLLLNGILAWDVVVVAAVVIAVAVAGDLSFLSEFRATGRAGPHL